MNGNVPMKTTKQIFRDRAEALAKGAREVEKTRPCLAVIELGLGSERYAVESLYVREVLPLKDLTPLPGTPPHILGITNVRGQIIAVMDLRVLFGLTRESPPNRKVIILKSSVMETGIIADVVTQARTIPLDEIQPAIPTLTGARETYLRGIAETDLVILDAAKLLADPAIIVNENIDD